MTANILDGKALASQLKKTLLEEVQIRTAEGYRPPALAVVLVGQDPASEVYVANKRKACPEVGMVSHNFNLPDTTSEKELLRLIHDLNTNPEIDGILIQLPLPSGINANAIVEAISPEKDVDGFHPYNLGRLIQRTPRLRPCTPYGIIQLLQAHKLPFYGQHAVVIGASNIVGRPMAMEFLLAGSTVTICHRFTENLEKHIRMADMIVVAAGVCDLIKPDWLQPNQILVDVGMHRLENGKLRGDVDFEKAKEKVAWITPVPGGVGPMTITSLLQNTLLAAKGLD
jgi:methylenetetrahydrofolate dehydrogenase (NADP+)/methenyltetrahydrofolate cyclohydrolase